MLQSIFLFVLLSLAIYAMSQSGFEVWHVVEVLSVQMKKKRRERAGISPDAVQLYSVTKCQ